MRLYLVRHPQPIVAQGVCYGASDAACSPSELDAAALELIKTLPRGLRVTSSPLQRCEQLAKLLSRLEPDFVYKTDHGLAEMNFGAWEMRAWDAIAPEELRAWTEDFSAYRCGGSGESAGQFVQRVARRLIQSAQGGNDEIWITHAGVIRALLWLASQSFETLTALAQRPGLLCEALSRLRAADWPRGELAFGRAQPWDWPQAWPR
jgi:alpha-ribazole phosphatase